MVDRADMDYIKNMAKDICHLDRNCDECNMAYGCKAIDYATRFYNANYRKPEWISVEERLPTEEENEIGLVGIVNGHNGNIGFQDAIILVEYDLDKKEWWSQDFDIEGCEVKWWMPLPMPPKGDEGK